LVQLNALLHVMQWEINPCKHENVCLVNSYSVGVTSYISVMFSCSSINWLAKHKKLNDFIFTCIT